MRLPEAALLFFGAMASAASAEIEIPGGSAGIGFDDLRFSASLGKVLVPAGRTGSLVLLDPATRNVTAIEGFSAKKEYGGGHDDGVTSADSGSGWIFATDRTSGLLAVIDPAGRRIVSRSKLGGAPDYVRYVEPAGEVWVTEPDSERIEIQTAVSAPASGPPPSWARDGLPSKEGPAVALSRRRSVSEAIRVCRGAPSLTASCGRPARAFEGNAAGSGATFSPPSQNEPLPKDRLSCRGERILRRFALQNDGTYRVSP